MKQNIITAGLFSIAALLFSGCPGPAGYGKDIYQDFQSESPAARIHACVQAGDDLDPKAVPYLVDRLSDSETDVRVYATLSLEKIVGTRMGYEYYGSPTDRQKAISRWRSWLAAGRPEASVFMKQAASQSATASAPASSPASQSAPSAETAPASQPSSKPSVAAPGGRAPDAMGGASRRRTNTSANPGSAPASRPAGGINRKD